MKNTFYFDKKSCLTPTYIRRSAICSSALHIPPQVPDSPDEVRNRAVTKVSWICTWAWRLRRDLRMQQKR